MSQTPTLLKHTPRSYNLCRSARRRQDAAERRRSAIQSEIDRKRQLEVLNEISRRNARLSASARSMARHRVKTVALAKAMAAAVAVSAQQRRKSSRQKQPQQRVAMLPRNVENVERDGTTDDGEDRGALSLVGTDPTPETLVGRAPRSVMDLPPPFTRNNKGSTRSRPVQLQDQSGIPGIKRRRRRRRRGSRRRQRPEPSSRQTSSSETDMATAEAPARLVGTGATTTDNLLADSRPDEGVRRALEGGRGQEARGGRDMRYPREQQRQHVRRRSSSVAVELGGGAGVLAGVAHVAGFDEWGGSGVDRTKRATRAAAGESRFRRRKNAGKCAAPEGQQDDAALAKVCMVHTLVRAATFTLPGGCVFLCLVRTMHYWITLYQLRRRWTFWRSEAQRRVTNTLLPPMARCRLRFFSGVKVKHHADN